MARVDRGLRVAVITPYYKETDEVLEKCLESVAQQTAMCRHFLVSDGFPNPIVDKRDVSHILLPSAHADNGNTPRVLGAISAFNQGFDAIAFLDADNWYAPDHIERMVKLQRSSKAAVCTSNRTMHRPDGSFMFSDDKNDGKIHVDTSCFFLTRDCRQVVARWSMMPAQLGPICDTVYFGAIKRQRLSRAHDPNPSVRFRSTYEDDFRRMNEAPPENVKTIEMTMQSIAWFKSLSMAERRTIARNVGWPPGGRAGLEWRVDALKKRWFPGSRRSSVAATSSSAHI